MNDSIHRYFKVGTIQWMSHPPGKYNLLDSLKLFTRDDYFDAIEITWIKDDETRAKAKAILEQSGMTVCYGAQPRLLGPKLNPNHLIEDERLAAEKTLLEAIDEAEYMGAKGIAFLSGKWDAETKELNYAQLLKTTRAVCDYAAAKNMTVELEVFDFDLDKAALIGSAPLAARFAADMRTSHGNFGLLADLSHFPTTYETSKFAVQVMRPYITHLHFGNAVVKPGCEAFGDMHPRFGYPNSSNGIEELVDFLFVLSREGFFNERNPLVLSMEVTPRPDEDADIVLANTKRALNRAWALLEI